MRHCDIPVVPLVGYRICTFYARHAKALKQDQKTHNYLQQTLNLSNARVEMSTPNERDPTNKKFHWFHWFPTGWWLGLGQPWSSFECGHSVFEVKINPVLEELVKQWNCVKIWPVKSLAFFSGEGGGGRAALVYEYFLVLILRKCASLVGWC